MSTAVLTPRTLAQLIEQACRAELRALKPGNAGDHGPAGDLTVADFERSAVVAADELARPGLSVGQRVLHAIARTRAAVGTNTNLGIVLLAAPLALAAERAFGHDAVSSATPATSEGQEPALRASLQSVLGALDLDDARDVYQAIRTAQAGGLGKVPEHDIADEPKVDLRTAMQAAAAHDQIANQYVTDYAMLFDQVLPVLAAQRTAGASDDWVASMTWLFLLGTHRDSLIARRHGLQTADAVSGTAAAWYHALDPRGPTMAQRNELLAWDRMLKQQRINPGTTADLLVASLLIEGLIL